MKRIIITLTAVFTLATTYSFANDVKITSAIKQAFQNKFADAQDVSWSEYNGFFVAEFTVNEEKQFAYFNGFGDLAVVAQPISVKKLSKTQQANLRKEYAGYTVANVYRLDDNEDVKYYAVVENDSRKIILSTNTAKWNVVKTSSK